jgi:hypothetical protein
VGEFVNWVRRARGSERPTPAMAAAGEKARVVLVGGGPAGSLFAKTMEGHADVVLLDP